MGVREDGITLTDDVSGNSSASANVIGTQTLNVLNEELTINVPDGYNSVTAILTPSASNLTLSFLEGSVASGAFNAGMQGFNFITGIWVSLVVLTGGSTRTIISFPVASGKPFSVVVAAYTSGSVDVELIASNTLALGTPLTNLELRAVSLVVNTELPTAAALADNTANPTVPAVGSFGMAWDGALWDKVKGDSTDGLLVNLGANNDVVVTSPTTLHVTNVGAANAAVTATLPAAGIGLFHYITNITLQRASTAALAGTAVLTHTSANLPGNPNWSVGDAMVAGGAVTDLNYSPTKPLKSSVANTNTTITMPAAGAAVLNRINISYYIGT